ncbi:hypothetical protein Tco_1176052 [Tanacetum coccineum]
MASGSHSIEEIVVLKFDMHTFTSNMTVDEVNNTDAKYGIPLDLYPRVPSSTMTMNKLSAYTIGIYEQYLEMEGVRVPFSTLLLGIIKHFRVHISQLVSLGLNRSTLFEIRCRSLGINPKVNIFSAFYKLNKQVHPGMLYEIGLTTIWKHVGYHPAFIGAEGNVVDDMFEFLKFPMASGVMIGRGTALRPYEVISQHTTALVATGTPIPDKTNYEKVVEHGDARIIAAKEKKKVNIIHSEAGGSNQALQSNENVDEEVANVAENKDNKVNSPHSDQHIKITSLGAGTHPSRVNVNGSTLPGLECEFLLLLPAGWNTFPGRNTVGDDVIGSFLFIVFEVFPGFCY